ncbi:MAG: VTT domain-containing protein [Patescibacteria group bacterium]
MLETLIASVQTTFLAFGPWGVFGLAFLQEIIPPIPSTLVTVTAGFVFLEGASLSFASLLKLFWMVGLPIAAGLTLGATIVYGVVYLGGRPIVEKWGSKIGFSWNDIEKLQGYMKGHRTDEVILFAARSFPLMPSLAINIFCGIVRWPLGSFLFHTFFGSIIRALWSGFVGWQFASIYHRYATVVEHINNIVLILLVVSVAGFLWWRRKKAANVILPTEEGSVE